MSDSLYKKLLDLTVKHVKDNNLEMNAVEEDVELFYTAIEDGIDLSEYRPSVRTIRRRKEEKEMNKIFAREFIFDLVFFVIALIIGVVIGMQV